MDTLIESLKKYHLFSTLSKNALEQLASSAKKITLKAKDFLYNQNDPSELIYIVMSGKLTSLIKTSHDEYESIDTIHPNELIGELGVLSGEPRSLAVMAVAQSVLISIPDKIFRNMCEEYPSILLATIQPVLHRTQKAMRIMAGNENCKYALILPANDTIKAAEFKKMIDNHITEADKLLFISDSDNQFLDKLNQLYELEKQYEIIIILSSKSEFYNSQAMLEKISRVYLLTHELSEVKINEDINEIINNNELSSNLTYELIVLHDEKYKHPKNTMRWLSKINFKTHHHINMHDENNCRRFIRFMTGKTTGLVLSGGGIRGWGHLGVIKALEEKNIPIDAIGGTSIGALIGACYALTRNYKDTYNMFQKLTKMVSQKILLKEITWPLISIFNAKHPTQALQHCFADIQIEDLLVSYFCVSANLSTQTDEVHHAGSLWEKTRASNALPGIVPPMVLNGQIHFDGGLLNNLPIDHMRNLLGHKSKIIACALSTSDIGESRYNFPPILTFSQALFTKLGIAHKDYIVPPFLDTFVKALLLGSSLKERQTISLADILINMQFEHTPLLFLKKTDPQQLIDIGYHEACKFL